MKESEKVAESWFHAAFVDSLLPIVTLPQKMERISLV